MAGVLGGVGASASTPFFISVFLRLFLYNARDEKTRKKA